MKKIIFAAALAASLGAHAGGHYVPGVEGIQAASVPPPGAYYLGYLVDYNIDQFKAPGTRNDLPGHNSGTVVALANRFVWISNHKFAGADFGMEAIVPVIGTSLTINAASISETRTGLGDVYLGPLVLGWHGSNWDAVASAGLWLDSASNSTPVAPGKGFKSTMLTAGATYYFDASKTISGSALMRFETNSKKSGGFKPGNQATLEWGIAKVMGPVQVGVVGYDQVQVSNDSGVGASSNKSSRHAIGAEVVMPIISAGVFLKAAAYKEYRSEAGTGVEPRGNLLRFTFVKAF
ncbi:transporter [Polaromonas hydrogenivorans]|uniref:Transporter n=1 Tax=Polaromonas hydrogenivorans TaxID=335476 RepID=A0AAU7LZ70_9BURK